MTSRTNPEETSMARTGSTDPKPVKDEGEPVVDFMADAPAERPYAEAISPVQRELLDLLGQPLPEETPAG